MDTLISLAPWVALMILGLLLMHGRRLLKPIRCLWLRIKYKRIDKACMRCGGQGEYDVNGEMGVMAFECSGCDGTGFSDTIFQHRHPIFGYQSRERWNKDVKELDEMMEVKR